MRSIPLYFTNNIDKELQLFFVSTRKEVLKDFSKSRQSIYFTNNIEQI